jgi:hypothetical protein
MKSNIKKFKDDKYVFVPNVLSKELVDFVTQYALFDEMQDFNVDPQVPKAHSKYADPAMETVLALLHPIIEKHTGLSLHPTYSYYRVYRNGDSLDHHTDRDACEISVTVAFNYSYDKSEYQWPIFIDGNPITMSPGDIAIYRGIDLDHWREPFTYPEDAWQVQAFLHYVDANGPYSNLIYDTRPSLGAPAQKSFDKPKSYITYTK